jgi:hypothetical protein
LWALPPEYPKGPDTDRTEVWRRLPFRHHGMIFLRQLRQVACSGALRRRELDFDASGVYSIFDVDIVLRAIFDYREGVSTDEA